MLLGIFARPSRGSAKIPLFDRFYKADQSRKGKVTGLGLSIAKGLMQKMNGSLIAELNDNQLFMKGKWKTGIHNITKKV